MPDKNMHSGTEVKMKTTSQQTLSKIESVCLGLNRSQPTYLRISLLSSSVLMVDTGCASLNWSAALVRKQTYRMWVAGRDSNCRDRKSSLCLSWCLCCSVSGGCFDSSSNSPTGTLSHDKNHTTHHHSKIETYIQDSKNYLEAYKLQTVTAKDCLLLEHICKSWEVIKWLDQRKSWSSVFPV